MVTQYIVGEGKGTPLQYSCLENPMDGGAWWAAVHGVATSLTRLSDFTFTFHFHALEKEMATHSSVLAWRIPGMAEPGGLTSMGLHRVGHDWSDLAAAAAGYMPMSGIAGGGFIPSSLRNFPTIFHSGCINLHSHQQARGFLFSTPSPTFIVCRLFDDGHSHRCEVISHCSFDFLFSNNKWFWAFFSCVC